MIITYYFVIKIHWPSPIFIWGVCVLCVVSASEILIILIWSGSVNGTRLSQYYFRRQKEILSANEWPFHDELIDTQIANTIATIVGEMKLWKFVYFFNIQSAVNYAAFNVHTAVCVCVRLKFKCKYIIYEFHQYRAPAAGTPPYFDKLIY